MRLLCDSRIARALVCVHALAVLSAPLSAHGTKLNAVCSELRTVLDARRVGKPDTFSIDSRYLGGGDTDYPNLDINHDGVADKVIQSCGSRDMPCSLFIELSDGKRLELLEEGRFFVGRYKSRLFVIVGDSVTVVPEKKRGKRRVFEITPTEFRLLCPRI